MAGKLPVSPLAPAGGFPALPEIDGVRFAAAEAGVRYQGRLDVMLAEICPGASVAGVFTRSATRAAPVLRCEACLATPPVPDAGFAILVNSGNANAFTGNNGFDAAEATATGVAEALSIPASHVYTASTGVIGEPLPAERITAKLGELAANLSSAAGELAARAIMTTDTFPKGAAATLTLGGQTVNIAGFAKGSGMIEPDMGTMLAYVFTDATIPQPELQAMLRRLTHVTFNAITVDSDTSTSDTLMLVATGKSARPEGKDLEAFEQALHGVLLDLAQQIVRDGEGASKFVEIRVSGAASDASAKVIGKAIGNSPLIKTAIAGEDPNWGRVVMAIGKAGEPAERDLITIRFGDILVAERGWVSPTYTEADGAAYMKRDELVISVDLGLGDGQATVWTCDLTHGYISINADYRS
ncbi:bifunctional glutamate N-acetyltransferase/amino-acid acetyltransferase ArgJ [Oceanibium sediminis]|uniref:bifunctional glutamate N-acetyltransferase/amino-acid acetyltransferase ArgJ n=1 Tax=Oceanibium sediminis TaxID=2026339 RepID=UPI000DD397A3|nr:bifunctional glutamate N-acetyltransferase/amino-acid acetyltransferase ArgJ [Oceanibium sediminis]